MSARAEHLRRARRIAMLPGSRRDHVYGVLKRLLPAMAAMLALVLLILPLLATREFSFLLSKDNAARADERMRVEAATYRGETAAGEPFRITAVSGVQKRAADPSVRLTGLEARIDRADGLATVVAPSGEFLIDRNQVIVNGPIEARSRSGYSLDGARILVDINHGTVRSDQPVSGRLPMGEFRAGRFEADIDGRTVIMDGGVTLSITQRRS